MRGEGGGGGPWTGPYSGPWSRSVGGSMDRESVFSGHPRRDVTISGGTLRNF